MYNVNPDLLFHADSFVWSIDASELGLPPGVFPVHLKPQKKFGNGRLFVRVSLTPFEAKYKQCDSNISLIVYND